MEKLFEARFAIVGVGLAGLILADSLCRLGVPGESILLFDQDAPGAGASGGPGFLLNPLPGRSLVPKPGYLEAFQAARQWYQEAVTRWAPDHRSVSLGYEGAEQEPPHPLRSLAPWLLEGGLLRPLMPDLSGSKRLFKSLKRALPEVEGKIHLAHLEQAGYTRACPLAEGSDADGAILVTPSLAMYAAPLLSALWESLAARGVQLQTGMCCRQLVRKGAGWRLHTEQGQVSAEAIILTMGAGVDQLFPELGLELLGGSLVSLRPPEGVSLAHLLGGAGIHIIPLLDGRWVIGATFEQPGEAPLSDEATVAFLFERGERIVPMIRSCEVEHIWRGTRATLQFDRMPVVGELHEWERPGVYMLGAFASKGLLMIPWLAQRLATHLLERHPVPALTDPGRVLIGSL